MSSLLFIGFDIGIKNLAYCVIERDVNMKLHLKSLNKVDLRCKKSDTQKIIDETIDILDEILESLITYDSSTITVLIESQMTSIMKSIQTTINTFFKMTARYRGMDIKTKYMSPRIKLNFINKHEDEYKKPVINTDSQYKRNKEDSIHFAEWYLQSGKCQGCEEHLEKYKTEKKKDDYADALLMTVAFATI
jgi:hypothetical protein